MFYMMRTPKQSSVKLRPVGHFETLIQLESIVSITVQITPGHLTPLLRSWIPQGGDTKKPEATFTRALGAMNPSSRGPSKRSICRYFASGGSCYYGDACQFQHVLDSSGGGMVGHGMPPPPGVGMPAGPAGAPPPHRSQSAGALVMRPSGKQDVACYINSHLHLVLVILLYLELFRNH